MRPTITPSLENLGAIPASQLTNGLGFNVEPSNEWEFAAVAAAGGTSVRFQCSWNQVESQAVAPANTNTGTKFALTANMASGLALCVTHGLKPLILAAYGPPYHPLLHVTVPGGAAQGATVVTVQFASGLGAIADIAPLYTTIRAASGAGIANRQSYAGALITGVSVGDSTHATLTLASSLRSALPANGALYTIHQYLYPPPAHSGPTEPSNLAYAAYVKFLAEQIVASGLTGYVEIWNEPPWWDDPWDSREGFYDADITPMSPGPDLRNIANFGFAAILQEPAYSVPGVEYVWGGTHKSGDNSLFNWQFANTGVPVRQPILNITTEALHPYGNNPEQAVWSRPRLLATISPPPIASKDFASANLFGSDGGNFALSDQWSLIQQSRGGRTWGTRRCITETGIQAAFADQVHRARHVIRQFLSYQAAGVTPIVFYRLHEADAGGFGFVDPATHAPLPMLAALAGLQANLGDMDGAPIGSPDSWALPAVLHYAGTFPITTVSVVGRRVGGVANSILYVVWQRSYADDWVNAPPPTAVSVAVQIPAGMVVTQAVNVATRAAVSYVVTGRTVRLPVSDDPIGLLLDPR